MQLKDIFQIKPQQQSAKIADEDLVTVARTYYQAGGQDCLNAGGNCVAMRKCMEHNYQQFKNNCQKNEAKQKQLKEPFVLQRTELEGKCRGYETSIKNAEEELIKNKEAIAGIRERISDIKSNPNKYGDDIEKKSRTSFLIGLAILLPITIYLLVFYISASYSAFFKVFDLNSGVIESIFDAQALSKAYYDGIMELIFVLTIPFVFMGLGYLIHMFLSQKKGVVKVVLLFVVTFLFDCILAYEIERKIYEVTRTLDSPEFGLFTALQTASFWAIIFAGFLVYLIWGFVFGFVIKEYENMDSINSLVRHERKNIEQIELLNDKELQRIKSSREQITKIRTDIAALDEKLNAVVIQPQQYKLYHTEYVKGWIMAIAEKIVVGREEKSRMIEDCSKEADTHINQILEKA